MEKYIVPLAVLFVLDVPVFLFIRRWFFSSWNEFFRAIDYLLMPDIVSWIIDDLSVDLWAEFKLALYLGACVAIVAAEIYWLLPGLVRFFS